MERVPLELLPAARRCPCIRLHLWGVLTAAARLGGGGASAWCVGAQVLQQPVFGGWGGAVALYSALQDWGSQALQ